MRRTSVGLLNLNMFIAISARCVSPERIVALFHM